MNWIEINEENKPDGFILGFNEKWIDEDFNPEGVRLCHWCDVSEWWVSSYWNNYHDWYETRTSDEDDEIYTLREAADQIPSHYCKIQGYKPK